MADISVKIAIIGAGTAGMVAYQKARKSADDLVLIEGGQYGTTCARVGCMPSKLLIAAAERAEAMRGAAEFGVGPDAEPRIDGAAVMARVQRERDRFVRGVLDTIESYEPEHRIRAHARFEDPHTLLLDDGRRVRAERIVVAIGSRPVWPGTFEAAGDRLATSDDMFDWPDLPGSVAVFGAGAIGLELAQALSRLGVRVRVFSIGGGVGPLTDPSVRDAAASLLGEAFPLLPDADVTDIAREGDEVVVRWTEDGADREERFDRLLAATGRKPDFAGLALENSGLELDDDGAPTVDPLTMRAGDSHIFVAGDASGRIELLHEAADDGRIAGENAARWPEILAHPRRAPLAIVFTSPGLATVGRSYADLCASPCDFRVGEVDFANQGRARVMGVNAGLLRVYGERGTGLFLGAEMIAPGAEHMAHLLAWAAQSRLDVDAMLGMPFYHPVLEEGMRTALRELATALKIEPAEPDRSIDCGPGG